MYLSKLRRKVRGISPVLAVLMMIVIAVAGSLVTYAWVMGYLSFTTAKAGRAIQIQSIANDETDTNLLVYVQNVGEGTVTFDPTGAALVYVNGGLLPCTIVPADGILGEGATAIIEVAGAAGGAGEQVRVKVVSLGGTFTEAAAYPGESTGSGGIVGPPPAVTRIQGSMTSFSSVPTEGNLLVVIAGHRNQATDSPTLPSMSGWDLAAVHRFKTPGSVTDRRAVAIFTKIAGASEGTTVPTVDWGTGGGTTVTVICQEFDFTEVTAYTVIDSGDANSGTSTVTSLTFPSSALSAGSTDNILTIAALITRDDSPVTTSVTYDNLGDVTWGMNSGLLLATGSAYTTAGSQNGQTQASWVTDPDMASGLMIFIQIS
jgi:flagellin-like protein